MAVILVPNGFQDHYTIGFANGVAANNIRIRLITSDNIDKTKLSYNVSPYNLMGSNQPERSAFEKTKNYLSYYMKLIKFVYAEQNAVTHITGTIRFLFVEGIIISIIMKMLSRSFILTVHNILPHDNEKKITKWLFKIIYRIPDFLIVHTNKVKEELTSNYHVCPEKIFKMEHGINDSFQSNFKNKFDCRRKLNVPTDRTVLLFFGRIAKYKGVDLLLKAFEMTDNNLYLVIAGRESRDYKNRIIHMLNTNKNKNSILHKIMFIPDDEISIYFNAADAIVLPYRHIDQSGVVFLAFKYGLPIIAFDVGAFSEYIDENSGIIVEEISAESLKDAMIDFVNTKEKYCRKTIMENSEKFAWNKVVQGILPLYDL